MAHNSETKFGDLQTDERYKKLQRSLKLSLLRKEHSKNTQNGNFSPVPTWPSISSINADTLDSSYTIPSLQISTIESEVVASSKNLRNIMLKRKNHNANREVMTTSSVRQYNMKHDKHIDQCLMPPPRGNTIFHTSKNTPNEIYISSNCDKAESKSLASSVSYGSNNFSLKNIVDCQSSNINTNKEYPFVAPLSITTAAQKIDRVFSKWRVMLNNQNQILIKGTLECGKIARSKPVMNRITATCIESVYKHRYNLHGNIVDERNELPDYIHGKFYNGFPDDWENVHQIWKAFINQGCSIMFRWPTPITDSDEDIKSEITDLTYTCMKGNKSVIELTETAGQLVNSENRKIKPHGRNENCYNNISTSQADSRNNSVIKYSTSNAEQNAISIRQIKNLSNEDNFNKHNVKLDTKNESSLPKKTSKLKDILQEDKLNIIINNLADRNCSPKYIDKIIEMFDCLDYVVSYRTGSECNSDSVISTNFGTCKSEAISLQQLCTSNKENHISDNGLGNTIGLKSHVHSSDLGYGSVKYDSSQPTHLSSGKNYIEPENNDHKYSDKSESETYTGIPKIPIERILQIKDASRKINKRKVKNKIHSNTSNYITNTQYKEKVFGFDGHAKMTFSDKKNIDESCVSITEDEIDALNVKKYQKAVNVIQRPSEMSCSNHQELQRNYFNTYDGNAKPTLHNERLLNVTTNYGAQRNKLNAFIKAEKIVNKTQKSDLPPSLIYVDYTSNSNDVKNTATVINVQKIGRTTIAPHIKLNQDVVRTESNNNLSEKPLMPRELRKKCIDTPKCEVLLKKMKPSIISSIPVNLNLKINDTDSKLYNADVSITDNEDKQCANTWSIEETRKKKALAKTSTAVKPVVVENDSCSKVTSDNKKRDHAISNFVNDDKTESNDIIDDINDINPIDSIKSTTNLSGHSKNKKFEIEDNNTKVLTSWIPNVVYYPKSKSELGLIFEGKLLNEAGHIMHRKFATDIVLKRISATMIETVNHEFYQLLGCMSNNKHVIPKELMKQCRNGCPSKIEQFCSSWKTLQHGNVEKIKEGFHNASMESLSVPVSSRGRRILPPLCYWTGERVTLKDNNPVYSAGNSQESSLVSLTESPKNTLYSEEKNKQQTDSESPSTRKNVNNLFLESKKQGQSANKSSNTKTASNISNPMKLRKSAINCKRRIAQQLNFSSADSSEEDQQSPQKCLRKLHQNKKLEMSSNYTMKLRKRQRTNAPLRRDGNNLKHENVNFSPTKKSGCNMTYVYYKSIALPEDLLSEDQVSSV